MQHATSWGIIREAALGDRDARALFAERYQDVVRAYLRARWRASPLEGEVEDATQEVFVICFREGGALQKAEEDLGSFRGFLFGVARNVALRVEKSRAVSAVRRADESFDVEGVPDREATLSQAFDRAWARAIVRTATGLLRARAETRGGAPLARVELLRLRFEEDLPIRTIAERTGVPADKLHNEYGQARREFKDALREALGLHERIAESNLQQEIARLLGLLR